MYFTSKRDIVQFGYVVKVEIFSHFRVNGSSVDISFPPMSLIRKNCPKGCDWAYVVAMRGLQQEYSNDIDISIWN